MTSTASYKSYPCLGDFGLDNSTSLRSKTIMSEVANMDLVHLITASYQIETTLAILFARAILIRAFASWPPERPLDQNMLGHHHLLLQLMKLLIFRGCQFPRLRLSDTAPCFATHAKQVSVVRDILISMLHVDNESQDTELVRRNGFMSLNCCCNKCLVPFIMW